MLLIRRGFVHRLNGEAPQTADVLIDGGRIAAVSETAVECPDAEVLDASALHLCPAMIDMHVHPADGADDEEMLRMMNSAGLSAVLQCARSGQAARLLPACGMRRPPLYGAWQDVRIKGKLHAMMAQAAADGVPLLAEIRSPAAAVQALTLSALTGAALIPVHLTGCEDMAGELAASVRGVVLDGGPGRKDPYDFAVRLTRLGVRVAMTTDYPTARLANLIAIAGLCCRAGMTAQEALSTVSSIPALLLGLTEQGTLAPGMIADIALFDGDPLRLSSECVGLIRRGRICRKANEKPAAAGFVR